jgi:hypothetical protein
MAVSLVFGMTESGKSYLVNKRIIPQKKKVVVFDYAHCFTGGKEITNIEKNYKKIFAKYSKEEKFYLIYRPPRNIDDIKAFDYLAALSIALGRSIGKNVPREERLLLVIDEADHICSPSFQSRKLKELVNKGRHDNVDTTAIARIPQRLHTDLRSNATTQISFRLTNDAALKNFRLNISNEAAKEIAALKKYYFLKWQDTGEAAIFDDRAKKIKSLKN